MSSPTEQTAEHRQPPATRGNPAWQLNQRYWCALGLIAALIVLHELILQPALTRLTSDAPVINVAGRQRMLSQKLAKAALALTSVLQPAARNQRHQELAATLQVWRLAHRGLQTGDAALKLPGQNPPEIQRAFQNLEPHFQAMSQAAEALLNVPSPTDEAAKIDPAAGERGALETILDHEPQFLTRMHAIVGLYEADARWRIERIQRIGMTIMAAILCVLIVVQMIVVRPAVSLLCQEFSQSESQYQSLVESMNDGMVLSDAVGRLKFANARFRKLMGCEEAHLLGEPLSQFIAARDRGEFAKVMQTAAERQGPVELAFQRKDGQVVETMISPQRLTNSYGKPPEWLLVIMDITARKAEEQRNRDLFDQLTHADRLRSLGEMAAGLAHEINQPLGAITNYAEGGLNQLKIAPEQAEELETPLRGILRAALRGGEIIRRTLRFTRLQPHRVTRESINDLVREVEQLCLPEARQRGVRMETELADALMPIPVDAIQIQQVLINLIQNAFAALKDADPTHKLVQLQTTRADEGWIEIAISDSGPGIAAADAERLFEPFVTTREEGTGMGLAIARSIVQAHGGQILVERNEHGGARFRFTLPTDPPASISDALVPAKPEMLHA